jgi:predicted DNA-binding transcriptional regulator AlpA
MNAIQHEPMLGVIQLASALALLVHTLWSRRQRWLLPPYLKLESRVVYRQSDVDQWLSTRIQQTEVAVTA